MCHNKIRGRKVNRVNWLGCPEDNASEYRMCNYIFQSGCYLTCGSLKDTICEGKLTDSFSDLKNW